MTRHLKAINHKAVKEVTLKDLGKLNVLCGKNNSGKTSLMEALCINGNYYVGERISDQIDLLMRSSFKAVSNNHVPDPIYLQEWYKAFYREKAQGQEVYFNNDAVAFVDEMRKSISKNQFLKQFKFDDVFGLKGVIENIFDGFRLVYKPRLIPPKRNIEYSADINFTQESKNDGNGLLNRLFYLKNQDFTSDYYQTYLNIYNTFESICGCKFNIIPNNRNQIIPFFEVKGRWISADECGLGLSDLLIIVHQIIDNDDNFIFIEEPENHLHALYQRNLLKYIKTIKEKQFFISTHSSVFLDDSNIDRLFYVDYSDQAIISDQTKKALVLSELGYSTAENLVSDAIILCEGPTDIPILKALFEWVGASSNFIIKYWPLGGDIMAQLDMDLLKQIGKVFALIDSDPGSSVIRTRFQRLCKSMEVYCQRLSRVAIENYLSVEAVRAVFPDRVPIALQKFDPKIKIEKQLKPSKYSIKGRNIEIIRKMKISDFEGTDLMEFIEHVHSQLSIK